MTIASLLDWTVSLADRCVGPPSGPGARLTMAGEGPTEQVTSLQVFAPERLSPVDRETRALLRRFSPSLVRRTPGQLGMAVATAQLAWRHGQGPEPTMERYRMASLASGRTLEATERRLGVIQAYAEAVSAGDRFPPVLLLYDGAQLIQLDGARRMLAHLLAGRTEIAAQLVVKRSPN
ncbi:MAG: hypothetical protein ACM3YN_10285 [Parcubacteria group bacterium]